MHSGEIQISINLIMSVLQEEWTQKEQNGYFKRSIEKHNLRYVEYFVDGDSKSYVSVKNVYERV